MPKISVIIPTYNRELEVSRAIASVLAQDFKDLEVLVCDDGSTDHTARAVATIMARDARVRFLPLGIHSGLPAVARNKGIREARGEWLAFLDSDDRWYPHKLSRQLAAAVELGLAAVSSNAINKTPAGRPDEPLLNYFEERINFPRLLKENIIIGSSLLVKKEALAGELFSEQQNLRALEDYEFWLRLLTRTDCAFLLEPLLVYYNNPTTSVRADEKRNWRQQKITVLKSFLDYAKERNNLNRFRRLARREILRTNFLFLAAKLKRLL